MPDGGLHEVILFRGYPALGIPSVVRGKRAGDIHVLRAGHAVAAARARHLHFGVDRLCRAAEHLPVLIRQASRPGLGRGADIVCEHLRVVHARQHAGDLGLVEKPAEGPLRRRMLYRVPLKNVQRRLRDAVCQLATPERFHYHDRYSLFMRAAQASASGLRILVHVVVLYQAHVPVPHVEQAAEHLAVAVVGKTYLAYRAAFFLFLEPFLDAQPLQPFPRGRVGEHVHQVIVDMIRAQPFQFLVEKLFGAFSALYHIMGQLAGDKDLVAYASALEYLSQGRLAARIDIRRVKIVHSRLRGAHDQLFGLRYIYASSRLRQAHAAVSENGYSVAVLVLTVIHRSDLPYLP